MNKTLFFIIWLSSFVVMGNFIVYSNQASTKSRNMERVGRIVWQTSKSKAMSLAKAEGKLVLLLAGRET